MVRLYCKSSGRRAFFQPNCSLHRTPSRLCQELRTSIFPKSLESPWLRNNIILSKPGANPMLCTSMCVSPFLSLPLFLSLSRSLSLSLSLSLPLSRYVKDLRNGISRACAVMTTQDVILLCCFLLRLPFSFSGRIQTRSLMLMLLLILMSFLLILIMLLILLLMLMLKMVVLMLVSFFVDEQ